MRGASGAAAQYCSRSAFKEIFLSRTYEAPGAQDFALTVRVNVTLKLTKCEHDVIGRRKKRVCNGDAAWLTGILETPTC